MKRRCIPLLLCLLLLLPTWSFAEIPDEKFTSEEVYSEDYDQGVWSYSNEELAIEIKRYHSTTIAPDKKPKEQPLVYYVAHIYERGINSFRSGFGNRKNPNQLVPPTFLARQERAVLAITGDNVTQQEAHMKGAIIRQGKVYNRWNGEALFAMKDDLTMQIFLAGEATAEDLLEMGIRETFSFGPWLIKDGVPNPDVAKFRVNRVNPRVGVGMVEPGHFVVIVVDGRQNGYSEGLNLEPFRDLFVAEGCVLAYNLDGGCSAGIVFMGELLNLHDGTPGAADYQRPWPDALMWGYSESVPTTKDKVYHDGNRRARR